MFFLARVVAMPVASSFFALLQKRYLLRGTSIF